VGGATLFALKEGRCFGYSYYPRPIYANGLEGLLIYTGGGGSADPGFSGYKKNPALAGGVLFGLAGGC